jgi:hypothetical protein
MQLGEGIDNDENRPIGGSCLDGTQTTGQQLIDDREYNAYYFGTEQDRRRMVEDYAPGRIIYEEIEQDFDNQLSALLDANSEARPLVIDLRIRTLVRSLDITEADCGNYSGDEELDEFIDSCGDEYLSDEFYGGHIFIYADVEGLSRSRQTELEDILGVGGYAPQNNFDEWLSYETEVSEALSFSVDTYGLLEPSDLGYSDTEMSAEVLEAYLNDLRSEYCDLNDGQCQALASGCDTENPPGPECGQLIEQSFDRYNEALYESCGLGVPYDQYRCYADFQGNYQESIDRLNVLAGWTQHVIDNSTHYDFPDTDSAGAVPDSFENANSNFEACLEQEEDVDGDGIPETVPGELTQAKTDCTETLENKDYSNLCKSCDPRGCGAEEVQEDIERVPHPVPAEHLNPKSPDRYQFRAPANKNMKKVETHVCMWTRVSGSFAGTGESVRLRQKYANAPPLTDDRWYADMASSQDEDPIGAFHCYETSNFFGPTGSGSSWMPQQDYQEFSVDDDDPPTTMEDAAYASALTGIRGQMQGSGEWGRVEQQMQFGRNSELESRSGVGDLDAFGFSWGVVNPGGALAHFYNTSVQEVKTNGNKEQQLAPVDRAACYLVQIQGEFDGAGEGAKIVEEDNWWWLRVRSRKGKDVRAKARCYLYNQQ